MDRETILAKSRKENMKKPDEMEKKVIEKSGSLAMAVGLLVCMVINVVEVLMGKETNPICWLVYSAMEVVRNTYMYVKLKKRLNLFLSIIYGILVVGYTVMYILRLTES